MKIVFTNGCFDLLHPGHLDLLKASKALGDYLIVAINSDASVMRLKGPSRPFYREDERVKMLNAVRWVDEVYVFDEDTPYELIKKLKPDIITKANDYEPHEVVGNDLAEVVIIPMQGSYSTTGIINEIHRRY